MDKNIKALSKMGIKTDIAYTAAGKQWLVKARLLKRAIAIDKKLIRAITGVMPVTTKKSEITDIAQKCMSQAHHNIVNRIGRTPKNPIPRTERRLMERLKAKGK